MKYEIFLNHQKSFKGDNEDKKAGSNRDEKIKSVDSGEPLTTNKSKSMETLSSSENEKTQNSSR